MKTQVGRATWLTALTLLLAAMLGCHDDDTSTPNACQQVCQPCDGVGSARVYDGIYPAAGHWGGPATLKPVVCSPPFETFVADSVCFQDSGAGLSCFYGCAPGVVCQ